MRGLPDIPQVIPPENVLSSMSWRGTVLLDGVDVSNACACVIMEGERPIAVYVWTDSNGMPADQTQRGAKRLRPTLKRREGDIRISLRRRRRARPEVWDFVK